MKEPPGWQVRVVPNKFPAVSPKSSDMADVRPHHALAALGIHEVIIENPRHNAGLALMAASEIEAVISIYRRRFALLLDRLDIETIVLFRNHGSASGASLVHPHAQLIGLNAIPPWIKTRERWVRERHASERICATCAELDLERCEGSRLIEETDLFAASVPFAATVPFEIMIVPKRHCGPFSDISDAEIAGLAALLGRTLRRLKLIHGDPPYNFYVMPASTTELRQSYSHWHLRIVPDLVKWGGFERATRMPINPSSPEEDAAFLRHAIAEAEVIA